MKLVPSPIGASTVAALASVPWCCVLPAGLSLLSLGGVVAARLWLTQFVWVLLPTSVALLGRAFWLLYVNHQGGPWSRRLAWVSSLLILTLWAPRLWAWFSW